VQIIETISSVFGHGHSHSHAHDDKIADLNAAWIALISIGVKEWIFAATMKVAKRTGSKVLVANAWHHRIDSLVSMVAVVTIGGGYFWGIKWLDPLGGLIVSSMIVRAGYTTAKSSVLELIDNNSRVIEDGKFEEHREQVQDLLRREFDSRYLVSKIELMPSGPSFISNIELTPTAKLESLREFQENCHLIKCKLAEVDPMLVRINITVQDPDSHI
jgi:divalent metal cation (Fe/Co/Zn/Cd) transporter